MSTQYRLMQSGKTASGGCSFGQGSSEPVASRIYLFISSKILIFFLNVVFQSAGEPMREGNISVFYKGDGLIYSLRYNGIKV
jgi:hypothetical protein